MCWFLSALIAQVLHLVLSFPGDTETRDTTFFLALTGFLTWIPALFKFFFFLILMGWVIEKAWPKSSKLTPAQHHVGSQKERASQDKGAPDERALKSVTAPTLPTLTLCFFLCPPLYLPPLFRWPFLSPGEEHPCLLSRSQPRCSSPSCCRRPTSSVFRNDCPLGRGVGSSSPPRGAFPAIKHYSVLPVLFETSGTRIPGSDPQRFWFICCGWNLRIGISSKLPSGADCGPGAGGGHTSSSTALGGLRC